MSDNDIKQENDMPQEGVEQKSCHKGSCCKPHASLFISVAALALAGYAAFNVNSSQDNSEITAQVTNLDSRVSGINQQLETLSAEMQNNRDNLVQNKLKKALESIRDISGLAEEGSKAAISKVEEMLQTLTGVGDDLTLPALQATNTTEQSTGASQMESKTATESETSTEQPPAIEPATVIPEATVDANIQPEVKAETKGDTKADTNKPDANKEDANTPASPQAF